MTARRPSAISINVQREAVGHNSRYGFWFGMAVFSVVAIILVRKG